MRLRILLLSLGITLGCVLLCSLVSTRVYYQRTVMESERYLSVYMNEFDSSYSRDEDGAFDFSEKLDGVRVTFLDQNGYVLADSAVEGEIQENHSDRQEILDAVSNGEGYAVRSSKTLGQDMVYYCRKIDDGFYVRVAVNIDTEWSMFVETLPTISLYLGVFVLLCVALTFVATYLILEPVKKLARESTANSQVETNYKELIPIANILNERNKSLSKQMDEIKHDKELVERERASKDEFISNVTHEMNTPLTSIKGYAELLGMDMLTEEQKQEAYKTIGQQSERLSGLIACIINYSEIDSDDLPPYEVDLSALAKETVIALDADAKLKNVKLIDKIQNNVKILSRHERVAEILGNLIRNAIKYNKDGGSVIVSVAHNQLIVEDTGIGIAEENLSKVFSRFFTVDRSHGGKNGGFGLGLAVVKKICINSGWKIDVESKLGEGSKFIISF